MADNCIKLQRSLSRGTLQPLSHTAFSGGPGQECCYIAEHGPGMLGGCPLCPFAKEIVTNSLEVLSACLAADWSGASSGGSMADNPGAGLVFVPAWLWCWSTWTKGLHGAGKV